MNVKENKGITLISLTVTIIILLIITGAIIFNTNNQIAAQKVNKLHLDLQQLNSKVDEYYLKYGELPILCDYMNIQNFRNLLNTLSSGRGATLNGDINPNDEGGTYKVIDLEKLGGITLYYGYEENGEYFTIKANNGVNINKYEDSIYVINTRSHQIYFPHGVFADNIMYVTF